MFIYTKILNMRTIHAYVNRYQFVSAFYGTFLDFLSSETFINTDWDAEMRGAFKSKIIEEYLKREKNLPYPSAYP